MSDFIQPSVTVSLVPQARGGPFVFWDDLDRAMDRSAALGFAAVEIFAPGPEAVSPQQLERNCAATGLKIAAVGTGAGWLVHQLSLADADAARRQAAIQFVRSMIDLGAPLEAPAIIGSMQGRAPDPSLLAQSRDLLADSLRQLAEHAAAAAVPLLYEPLNRYETNLCNTIEAGAQLITSHGLSNVLLLADLFHMNIEEVDIAATIRQQSQWIGHVHFVDSNRRAAGFGHLDFSPIASALKGVGYAGYLSAEAFPWPDADTAAQQTMVQFRKLFGTAGSADR